MSSNMECLLARGRDSERYDIKNNVLTAHDAEYIFQSLSKLSVKEVASKQWFQQQSWIEKLNFQSHANAVSHTADFVVEGILSFLKVETIVHELLVIGIWKEKMLPFLIDHLVQNVDSITTYSLMFHEANVANLLEMVLFDEQSFTVMDDEYLVELVDWCNHQITYLALNGHKDAQPLELPVEDLVKRSERELFNDRLKEIRLSVATCAITILRYITSVAGSLPISVVTRVAKTHDIIPLLVTLLDSTPWMRRRKGVTERLEGMLWKPVAQDDRFKLGNVDAQVWLALNNLVVDPHFRSKYKLDDFRKGTLCKIRRHVNDILIDQLPVLKDLQRVIDEISLNYTPGFDSLDKGSLVIEQVPQLRENMLDQDWEQMAKDIKRGALDPKNLRLIHQNRVDSMLAAFEMLAEVEDLTAACDTSSSTISHSPVTVSMYRKNQKDLMIPVHDMSFSIDVNKAPVPVTLRGKENVSVNGERWSLNLPSQDSGVVPHSGRIAVCYGSLSAQALLELPYAETKQPESIDKLPSAFWVTVGLLAQDKFVLQLHMKKAPRSSYVRNSETGVWDVYQPTGGAITVFKEVESRKENKTPARLITEIKST